MPGRLGFPIGLLLDGLSLPIQEPVVEYESPLPMSQYPSISLSIVREVAYNTIRYFVPDVDEALPLAVEDVFETAVLDVLEVALETLDEVVTKDCDEVVAVPPVAVLGTHWSIFMLFSLPTWSLFMYSQ